MIKLIKTILQWQRDKKYFKETGLKPLPRKIDKRLQSILKEFE